MTAALSSTSEPIAVADQRETVLRVEDLGVWYRVHHGPKPVRGPGFGAGVPSLGGLFGRRPTSRYWALRGLNFSCQEGQSLGILGGNGAGKSTLCLALAGIIQPDEGSIDARGGVTPLLGLSTGLNRALTGRQNIAVMAAFMGIPTREAKRRTPEILEFSGIGDFADEPVSTYSSGMSARLSFSIVTSFNPDILILDEVLGVGDREFRQRSQERMNQLMEHSRLLIIVSHSLTFLKQSCTHGLWMEKGVQRLFGEIDEVVDAYMEETDKGKKPAAKK